MQNRAIKLIFTIFSAIWMVIIFSEYWRYNPNYSKSIEFFQYYDLLILFVGLGSLASWFLLKPRSKPIKYLNGISVFLALLFLDGLAINRFMAKINSLDFTINGLFTQMGHIVGVVFCLFFVYLVVRVIGGVFTSIFSTKIAKVDLPLIQVALGIMFLTFLMFLLGLIGLLNPFVLVPLFVIVLAFYWRHTTQYFKDALLKPIAIQKDLNVIGIFSFLFLAIFLILNFGQILRPFPYIF